MNKEDGKLLVYIIIALIIGYLIYSSNSKVNSLQDLCHKKGGLFITAHNKGFICIKAQVLE